MASEFSRSARPGLRAGRPKGAGSAGGDGARLATGRGLQGAPGDATRASGADSAGGDGARLATGRGLQGAPGDATRASGADSAGGDGKRNPPQAPREIPRARGAVLARALRAAGGADPQVGALRRAASRA
jgi:hypothetical protein